MSKVAEQKALEAYPTPLDNEPFISKGFVEEKNREGYIKGYDQAMQDFLEKAESFIENKVSDYFWWNQEECFVDFDKEECIKNFKNHMQNESEN